MSRRARYDHPGCIHHVASRGLEKRLIFEDDEDRERYVRIARFVLKDSGTRCLAWSLMPNHVHNMLQTGEVPLSRTMHRINSAYAAWFNARHGRVGPLFQGRFLSKPVKRSDYLYTLIRYIHLNPVRAGLVPDVDALSSYPWTGHRALITGHSDGMIDLEAVTELFAGRDIPPRVALLSLMLAPSHEERYPPELIDLAAPDDCVETRHDRAEPSVWQTVGDRRLIADVASDLSDRERRLALLAAAGVSTERFRAVVCRRLGVAPERLRAGCRSRNASEARAIVAWLAASYASASKAEIARAVGVSRQAIAGCIERGRALEALFDPRRRLGRFRP